MQRFNPITMAKSLLMEKLQSARLIVDATAGNGHDTLFLAENTPNEAVIMAFDLQETAIKATKELLKKHDLLHKVDLVCADHASIKEYVANDLGIDVAMFNLGYLPGETHKIFTQTTSTMFAVNAVMEALEVGGVISVITYPGHEEGQKEERELKNFFAALPINCFSVIRTEMFNHVNNPPVLYLLEKVKKR